MRLVTANLYNGRVVPDDLRRFLDRFQPDLMCAQEVGHAAAAVLEDRFGHGRIEPAIDCRGKAMVATFPIEPHPIDLAWRGGFRARVVVDGVDTDVVSAHLANPIDWGNGVSTRRAQLAGLRPILRQLEVGVLVGDMNATPMWPAYRSIRRFMDDGVADWARRVGRRPERTWGPDPASRALLRIDHIFTRRVDVSSVSVVRIAGMDHRALVGDIAPARTVS